MTADYTEIAALQEVFLEESWVLGIEARPGSLIFRLDMVLTVRHPMYHSPASGEQFCYRTGVLAFLGVSSLMWSNQGAPPARDAIGQLDYDNIDHMDFEGDRYRLDGSWGEIEVVAEGLAVSFDERSAPPVASL